MKFIGAAFDRLEDALGVLAAALIVFSVTAVTVDVLSRFFLNRPLAWVFEITEYILLFVPCLGMAWLARNDGHVAIDIVTARVAPALRAQLGIVVSAVTSFVCAFVAYWGVVATLESYRAKAVIENILQVPQAAVLGVIPLGFGLCAVEFARKSFRTWVGRRQGRTSAPAQRAPGAT